MASPYQEALRPGAQPTAPDAVLSLSAAPHSEEALRRRLHLQTSAPVPKLGEFQPPEDGLILPAEPISPDQDPRPVLIRYDHGLDLVRKSGTITTDPRSLRGFDYENLCFEQEVGRLKPGQFGFGPGIVDAFARAIRPDALIVKISDGKMTLASISEYKLGQTNGRYEARKKLPGFVRFTRMLRKHPEVFSKGIKNATGGDADLLPLVVPPNEEITIKVMNPLGDGGDHSSDRFPFRIMYIPVPTVEEMHFAVAATSESQPLVA